MEGGGRRSGEPSGVVIKKRSSSGCLIVKKKGDRIGGISSSSGNRPVYDSLLENKRSRMVMSDSGSGSSGENMVPCSNTVHQTIHRHCNGFDRLNAGEGRFDGKRECAELVDRKGDCFVGNSSGEWRERKRNRLDEVEYDNDEKDEDKLMTMRARRSFDSSGVDIGRKAYLGFAQFGIGRKYGIGSSRDFVLEKRRKSYFDGLGAVNFADQGYRNRFKVSADESEIHASLLRTKYKGETDFDEPIRVQGKNGVLKVMINKKNKMSGVLLRNFANAEAKETKNGSKVQDTGKIRVAIQSPATLKAENLVKPHPCVRTQSNGSKTRTTLAMKNKGLDQQDSEDRDMLARPQKKTIKAHTHTRMLIAGGEKIPPEELAPPKIKDGKVRRGSGTEKQRLRERIRGMLLEAGWTIDHRPRRNRDYVDAVYISPTGTAYWSIIKAYEALLKQLNNGETEAKPSRDSSKLSLISDEILSQLTRKTKRKVEKDLKRRQQGGSDSDEKNSVSRKFSTVRHDTGNEGRYFHIEKLSSSLGMGAMSMRNEINHEAGLTGMKYKSDSDLPHQTEKSAGSFSHHIDGGNSGKFGRSTLSVRCSTKENNSESDGFVPFSGKRTVLAWLIDSGTVQLSEKVMNMNRQQSRAMLEGWITGDGIQCGCCRKLLSVSKFEIHAGSKLPLPFQNMYLDSGVSLFQCQIDAWDRQRDVGHIGFCSVDVNADDPNDDACGICGDGGDLICCDGCPSTFHQRCLDIQMFPHGDWHCPNCTCKFCRAVVRDTTPTVDASLCKLLTCKMCEKKYHKSCMQEVNATPTAGTESGFAFCGKECKELFEGLQKCVGIKRELEAGFSWSLVHRTEIDSDSVVLDQHRTVENNSKLAVALTVMDECFLPVIDRRSGVNIIRNVLYNCGSNFNRLNFGGFYSAILERDDEIIASASIRFRGDRLAEMPFIGTRPVYRCQGMCRRLFNAIESKDLFGHRHAGEDSASDTDIEIKRELCGIGREDCQNEDMDSAIKTTEVDVLRPGSRLMERIASSSSSPSTSPSEDRPVSDSAVDRRNCVDSNKASRDDVPVLGGLPTWPDDICPNRGETEYKPSMAAAMDRVENGVGSGYGTSSDSPRRRELVESPPHRNCDMAFLDHIIRSPVDTVTAKEDRDLYCPNSGGGSISPARQ
ncbi:PREDICTED: increased DNA methylation 1 isoform X2 [Tarenaya hassleriana]|uniref:increased DNA methylation 1 isoform X2 n=1 Tax=Tarenaya hassleriana TaxID=28532 RepID=UPI00053C6A84|nr:PREDICTED: increased DNA methylation 1 isoform X2 [Tarenaya hassleriana]